MAFANLTITPATASDVDFSFTHTPGGGVDPGFAAVVLAYENASNQLVGVTYGGVAMAESTDSPLLLSSTENMGVNVFLLHSSIPTGAQNVSVNLVGGGPLVRAWCVTLSTAADTELVNTDNFQSTLASNPSNTIALGGEACFVMLVATSGRNDPSQISPLSGWSVDNTYEHDFGGVMGVIYTYNTIGTSDVTFGYTAGTADECNILCIAVKESAGGAPPAVMPVPVGRMEKPWHRR